MGPDGGHRLLWRPDTSKEYAVDRFRHLVNARHGVQLGTYEDLRQWSVENLEPFWADVWQFTNVLASQPYTQVLDTSTPFEDVPAWFPGARLNYAENLLRWNDDRVALIGTGEGITEPERVTYRELRDRVAHFAAALRREGVGVGDRVAGYVPNCVDGVVAVLATSALGAIWSSTSPDFGVGGVLDRFSQTKPKVLFSVEAVWYNGKRHDHLEKLKQVVEGLRRSGYQLARVVVLPFAGADTLSEAAALEGFVQRDKWLAGEGAGVADPPPLVFEQLPFGHPLYIMFSSGTTGVPKCIVHGQGGTLLQHNKEHIIHGGMTRDDIMLYYTTAGWMMWQWLLGVLAVGATAVLYDGSPFKPTPTIIFDLCDALRVTILGTGAKWLASIEAGGLVPRTSNDLSSLRMILSTGSPLSPESFDYVYASIKSDVVLGSITGGTDIVSLFAGHCDALPVYRGEIQCRCLGMAIESWEREGAPVYDRSGELVCTKPFPCMPVFFWGDEGGEKYRKAYFSKFKNVWHHGDFLTVCSNTGGVVMLGRSDGTLNPAGVRFGSAEIYNVVQAVDEVEDSLCVGQRAGADERVVLFVKPRSAGLTEAEFEALSQRLKAAIREQLSPRHVPSVVLRTSDIPYTINGKKVEVAVKRVISGEAVDSDNLNSLSNPHVLDLYRDIPELKLPPPS